MGQDSGFIEMGWNSYVGTLWEKALPNKQEVLLAFPAHSITGVQEPA